MLTAAQLVSIACQDARRPGANGSGFSPLAGQKLNLILNELCLKYSLPVNMTPTTVSLTGIPAGPAGWQGVMPGIGPYPLPSNYLRMAQEEVIYNYQGAPQKMINTDLSDIDFAGLFPLNTNYPTLFATDINTQLTGVPSLYVWPPPAGAITLDLRYFALQPDIATPETSTTVPWYQDQLYLIARLTGEMLKPDPRAKVFLDEASERLEDYLKMADDDLGRAAFVRLDARQFSGGGYDKLPRTKKFSF